VCGCWCKGLCGDGMGVFVCWGERGGGEMVWDGKDVYTYTHTHLLLHPQQGRVVQRLSDRQRGEVDVVLSDVGGALHLRGHAHLCCVEVGVCVCT
jgi:hypothetical protein